MSLRTIRTDLNGVFLCLQCYIAAATHDEEGSSSTTIDKDSMALMLCPSALSAPTLMGYFYAYNAILQPPHTMRRVDVVLAATPNLASSGLIRCCSTVAIDNCIMALMLCPSALSVPTSMGLIDSQCHFEGITRLTRRSVARGCFHPVFLEKPRIISYPFFMLPASPTSPPLIVVGCC